MNPLLTERWIHVTADGGETALTGRIPRFKSQRAVDIRMLVRHDPDAATDGHSLKNPRS